MEIYKYDSYGHYLKSQIEGNLLKIKRVVKKNLSYVRESTIQKICKKKEDAKRVLCHGTRNAKEQIFFKQFLPDAYVIGSEISTNASDFPMTVEHDFNKVKKEWINSFDIVYSNSIDHSITPKETLSIWKNQLNKKGLLFLEHTTVKKNHVSSIIDPLKIEKEELISMIDSIGVKVIEELESSKNSGYILVCEKK
jgi:hypothetical protein